MTVQVPPLTDRDRMRRPLIPPSQELHLQGHGFGDPGALVLAASLKLLPNNISAICLPFQGVSKAHLISGASLSESFSGASHTLRASYTPCIPKASYPL